MAAEKATETAKITPTFKQDTVQLCSGSTFQAKKETHHDDRWERTTKTVNDVTELREAINWKSHIPFCQFRTLKVTTRYYPFMK